MLLKNKFIVDLKYRIKEFPIIYKVIIKPIKIILLTTYFLNCNVNRFIKWNFFLKNNYYLHLGCGDTKLEKAINVDARYTSAADIRYNCINLKIFPSNHFQGVFSNAFWEHVYLNERQNVINSVIRVIRNDGFVFFTGIPDFEIIAKAYLNKEPGITTEIFDLTQVYRFTHGGPESTPSWWLENLHKSLFDLETVNHILTKARFSSWVIFRYPYMKEVVKGQLGFLAFKQGNTRVKMESQLHELIVRMNLSFIDPEKLEILLSKNSEA